MISRNRRLGACVGLLAVVGLAVTGCDNPDMGTKPAEGPTIEQKISAIENDKTMPAGAKAGAIASLKAQAAAAQQSGAGSGNAQADAAKSRGPAPTK